MKTYALKSTENFVDFRSYEDGVYFGDPCYVVPDKRKGDTSKNYWLELVNMMYIGHKETLDSRNEIRVVEIDNYKFYMWSTAFGDGGYGLKFNGKDVAGLCVDAGCLSVIPMKLINIWGTTDEAKRLGYISTGPDNYGFMSVEEANFHWNDWYLPTGIDWDDDSFMNFMM